MSKLPESIDLTDAEYDYIALNLTKLMEHRKKFPDKFSGTFDEGALDMLHKTIIVDKLKSFKMRRRERRLLQIYFAKAVIGLETFIIPGYKKRMITPQTITKYESYWKAAKDRRLMIIKLVQKLEEGL